MAGVLLVFSAGRVDGGTESKRKDKQFGTCHLWVKALRGSTKDEQQEGLDVRRLDGRVDAQRRAADRAEDLAELNSTHLRATDRLRDCLPEPFLQACGAGACGGAVFGRFTGARLAFAALLIWRMIGASRANSFWRSRKSCRPPLTSCVTRSTLCESQAALILRADQ